MGVSRALNCDWRGCANDCDKGRGCQFFKIKEGV